MPRKGSITGRKLKIAFLRGFGYGGGSTGEEGHGSLQKTFIHEFH